MTNPLSTLNADLDEWLRYIEAIHPAKIDLTLDRVQCVKNRLSFQSQAKIFTIAGTNGKGSTCALIDSILRQAGYSVGLYTSPHLVQFNERAKINGQTVSDACFIEAFQQVEAARCQTPVIELTYFEFTTLAIVLIFARHNLDAFVLEVGLGGRLDAVNCFDTDCAICTSIDIDHQEYLGNTREAIGFEKAGIFRTNKPAIVADPSPPESIARHAVALGAQLWQSGSDFRFTGGDQQWDYRGRTQNRLALPYPALRGTNQLLNASAALAALEAMRSVLPVSAQAVRQGLLLVDLPGRFQVLPGQPATVLDVAHNPHAAAHLAASLENMGFFQNTHCIFGMLKDKDIQGVVQYLKRVVNHWHLVTLPGDRGQTAQALAQILIQSGVVAHQFDWASNARVKNQSGIPRQPPLSSAQIYDNVEQAYQVVTQAVSSSDRILVCGSFLTVGLVLSAKKVTKK